MSDNRLFVYGTLKKGHGNNLLLRQEGVQPEENNAVLDGIALYEVRGLPVAVMMDGHKLHCEAYVVPDDVLCLVDKLEGHPFLYQRAWYTSEDGRGGWVYLANHILGMGPTDGSLIKSGVWEG